MSFVSQLSVENNYRKCDLVGLTFLTDQSPGIVIDHLLTYFFWITRFDLRGRETCSGPSKSGHWKGVRIHKYRACDVRPGLLCPPSDPLPSLQISGTSRAYPTPALPLAITSPHCSLSALLRTPSHRLFAHHFPFPLGSSSPCPRHGSVAAKGDLSCSGSWRRWARSRWQFGGGCRGQSPCCGFFSRPRWAWSWTWRSCRWGICSWRWWTRLSFAVAAT